MKGVHCGGYKYVFYNVWKYWYLVIVSIIKTARLEFIRYYSQSSWFDFFFFTIFWGKNLLEESDKKVLWTDTSIVVKKTCDRVVYCQKVKALFLMS